MFDKSKRVPVSPEEVDPDAPPDGESLIPRDYMDLGPVERKLRRMNNLGQKRSGHLNYECDDDFD